MPRPGSLRLRSGTMCPCGETTKRISSSIGRTSRLTAHIRMVADLSVRGPWSSSGSVSASIRVTSSFALSRLIFGRLGLFGGLGEIGLGDPAGLDTGLHDHRFSIVTGDFEAIERARIFGLLAALLALGPADQIVRGATGEVVDRLDVVLAELHQHLRGDAGHVLHCVLDAELLAPGLEFGFQLFEIFTGAVLEFLRGLLVETFDAGEFLDVHHREFLDRGEAFGRQQLADHFVDIERFHEDAGGVLEIGLAALRFLLLGQDVDVPAGELRGQTHILAAAADRQRELVVGVGYDDLDALAVFVDDDLGDFGRRQRVDHEGRDVGRPRDDVDLLALQFVHHRLHARTAHTDAGADRIDRGITGNHADFCARAGIAGDRLDLDDAVIDLGHFLREQLCHELRMGAGEEDLRAAGLAADVEDVGPDAVAVAEYFARQHLVATDDGLAAAEIDDHAAIFDALDDTVDDVADAVLEFHILPVALGFAHLLHDHLLGGLRGDAAIFQRRQGVGDGVADLGTGIGALRIYQRDLVGMVFDRVDHQHVARQPQLALLRVDLGVNIGLAAVTGPRRLGDGILHRRDDDAAVDRFLARNGVGDLKQFKSIGADSHG